MEQQEESKRLEGRMLLFLQKAHTNKTANCFSFAGINIVGPKTQIVARIVAFNRTLTVLNLSRKGIMDKEGQDLARALLTNQTLRKLELEGNCLELQTARAFACALRTNKTLRYLDLESNNLTHHGEDSSGVEQMIQALTRNTSLLSLNLANNHLCEAVGRLFCDLFSPRG